MLSGVDISQYQGIINFPQLKATGDFVMLRANFGTPDNPQKLNEDTEFRTNLDAVRQYEIPHGIYHYAYPEYNTPEAEADFFASIMGDIQDNEILALDWEEGYAGDHVAWVKSFLDRLASHFDGYKAILYMNYNEATSHDWTPVVNEGYGLWLADWDNSTTQDFPKVQWPFLAFKQDTNNASVAGIPGRVDGDIFYGDLAHFYAYAYHKPTPQVVPEQPAQDPKDVEIADLKRQIDSLTKQLNDATSQDKADKQTISDDDAKLAKDVTDEATLTQKVNDLSKQVDDLTQELKNKGQIVTPLQPQEDVVQRIVDFFNSLLKH